jgi:hypothetical protein
MTACCGVLGREDGEGERYLVDVAEEDGLDGGVFEDFTDDAAVSAANDEDRFWVWVGCEGEMCDHFLVGEFIALCALNRAIEDEDVAVRFGLEDEDVLICAFFDVEDALDAEGHGLPRPLG